MRWCAWNPKPPTSPISASGVPSLSRGQRCAPAKRSVSLWTMKSGLAPTRFVRSSPARHWRLSPHQNRRYQLQSLWMLRHPRLIWRCIRHLGQCKSRPRMLWRTLWLSGCLRMIPLTTHSRCWGVFHRQASQLSHRLSLWSPWLSCPHRIFLFSQLQRFRRRKVPPQTRASRLRLQPLPPASKPAIGHSSSQRILIFLRRMPAAMTRRKTCGPAGRSPRASQRSPTSAMTNCCSRFPRMGKSLHTAWTTQRTRGCQKAWILAMSWTRCGCSAALLQEAVLH